MSGLVLNSTSVLRCRKTLSATAERNSMDNKLSLKRENLKHNTIEKRKI